MTDVIWRFVALAALIAAALFAVQAWSGQRPKLMYRPGDPLFLPSDGPTRKFHGWTAASLFVLAIVSTSCCAKD